MSVNENATTPITPAQPTAEEQAAATAAEARSLEASKTFLHSRWGWDDADIARGLERAAYTQQRLGITADEANEYERRMGAELAMEHAADLERGLKQLPEDLTPEAAAEMLDLKHEPGFLDRARADRKLQWRWNALAELASRRRR